MPEKKRRTWVYVQRPAMYGVDNCPCGNADPDWSEFEEHLWCPTCQKDFQPRSWGLFDGPVGVCLCELLGIYFDRVDLVNNKLLPDWEGNFHYTQNLELLHGNDSKDE